MPPQGTNRPVYLAFSCGLIELKNKGGEKIPLLKDDIFSPKLYPERFNATNSENLVPRNKYGMEILMVPPSVDIDSPDFLRETNTQYSTAIFNLNTYFKPPKPGIYILTMWPKIYKQSEFDKEIYQRIDLPPVMARVNWNRL